MKTRIVRVGNSQGVRIPKVLLEQTGLSGAVEIAAAGNTLVIKPAGPRAGWAAAFGEMAKRGGDALLDPGAITTTTWDEDGWEWP
jgi:antitoxin MazE